MTRVKNSFLGTLALLCLAAVGFGAQSCAIIKAFSADGAESRIPAAKLENSYHPAGKIIEVDYDCSTGGASRRRMLVYLPKSYFTPENKDRRFPVLYLLHGARGNETSWYTEGTATVIADRLWEEGLAADCILVMPNMNQYSNDAQGEMSTFKKPFDALFGMDGAAVQGFVHDVVGTVDRTFRTKAEKKSRAIAGLSIGAMQSIYITANYPDVFDEIGLFSPLYKSYITHGQYSHVYDHLIEKQKIQFENAPSTYNIYIGTFDFFINHMYWFRQYLYVSGFQYKFIRTGGGHDWKNWKNYLTIFMQEIFPEEASL